MPFERNSDAVSLDLSHCIEFLTLDENDADTFALSNVLRSLTECESILQQTKVLQENKTFFKSIIGKDLDGRGGIAHKKVIFSRDRGGVNNYAHRFRHTHIRYVQ